MKYSIKLEVGSRVIDATEQFPEHFNPHPGSMILFYADIFRVKSVDYIVSASGGGHRSTRVVCTEIPE